MVCLLEFRSTIEGTLLDYKTILKKFQFENRTLYFIFNMLFFFWDCTRLLGSKDVTAQ